MAIAQFPTTAVIDGKQVTGVHIYHLICAFCGDSNIDPTSNHAKSIEEVIVYCNCCSKTGRPLQINYDQSLNKHLN